MEEMTNEVVEETTGEIATAGVGKGKTAKIAVGVAALIGGSVFFYKKVIKPEIAKAKAKKDKVVEDSEESDEE